jgi:hypothetical protein
MSSVDQAVIDRVEGVSIWGVSGLEVDLFVHEVRTFDRHLPACAKVDQSEAISICTLMQAVLANRWLMYGLPANFCVRVFHHQLHVMTWAGCVCPLQLDPWPLLLSWWMYVDERVVEKSAFYSNYAETLVDWCKVYNHVVKLRIH